MVQQLVAELVLQFMKRDFYFSFKK